MIQSDHLRGLMDLIAIVSLGFSFQSRLLYLPHPLYLYFAVSIEYSNIFIAFMISCFFCAFSLYRIYHIYQPSHFHLCSSAAHLSLRFGFLDNIEMT